MEKYTCKLKKDEILAILVEEFAIAQANVDAHPENRRAVYREKMMLDLLHRIPIFDKFEKEDFRNVQEVH